MKLSKQSSLCSKPMFSGQWLFFVNTLAVTTYSHSVAAFHRRAISAPTEGITIFFMAKAFECSLRRGGTLTGTLGTAGGWTASIDGGFSAFSMSGPNFRKSFRRTISARCSMPLCVMAVSSHRGEHNTMIFTTSPMIYARLLMSTNVLDPSSGVPQYIYLVWGHRTP